jgi:hypothetical protein
MTTGTPVIQASEAAFLLRAKLGPIRAWGDFLADNIRGRQDIHGLTLKPCCKKTVGRGFRPMYALTDVEAFIAKVLKVEPKAGRVPIKPMVLVVDRHKPWWLTKFDNAGTPVALQRQVFRYAGRLASSFSCHLE